MGKYLPFEETDEGRVVIALKQGVFNAVAEEIKERFGNQPELGALKLYNDALAALSEIDKLEDSLTEGANPDSDTE
jgi:hypothetical protein